MKIHDVIQKTPEWDRLRNLHFTASVFDSFCLEPCKVTLKVDELKEELDRLGIPRKGLVKKEDLIAVLPNADAYKELSNAAMTAISKKIHQCRIQGIRDKRPEDRTAIETALMLWQDEIDASNERKMGFNIAIKFGNEYEPAARKCYEQLTGCTVEEIGFVSHDTGGFGCSPDGLIFHGKSSDALVDLHPDGTYHVLSSLVSHGLEIKCPMEKHTEYVIGQKLPDEYFYQVHGSMAVTGLDRWDFVSYMPGEPPLIVTVLRDETTNLLEAGLIELVAHKAKVQARLAELWNAAYANQAKLEGGAA